MDLASALSGRIRRQECPLIEQSPLRAHCAIAITPDRNNFHPVVNRDQLHALRPLSIAAKTASA